MKWYIAGPLFNDMERARNVEISHLVGSLGHTTYLPQRDGGVFSEMVASGKTTDEVRKSIFKNDLEAIQACEGIICLLDGRVPDEGMCIELGIAHTHLVRHVLHIVRIVGFQKQKG
jgi:nucleoside 2-deoxyribosyltransferase